jgi:hypothetical protein
MAVLQRSKSTVFGLSTDLSNLSSADAALDSRVDTLEADASTVGSVAKAQADAQSHADSKVNALAVGTVASNVTKLTVVQGTGVGSISKAEVDAKAYTDTQVTALTDGKVKTLEDLVAIVNGDSDTVGSFRKEVADVVGAAPEALNTLQEIGASLANDPSLDSTMRTLIATNIEAAKAALKGDVSEAMDSLGEVEDALDIINGTEAGSIAKAQTDAIASAKSTSDSEKCAKAQNLADVDANAARTNLDVMSKEETNAAIGSGGAIFKTEIVTVAADKITLAFAPKNGVLFNFNTVRHVDENNVAYDIETSVVAGTPTQFNLNPDSTGEFDGKLVTVQYAYST